MNCPICHQDSRVLDTNGQGQRRRECLNCHHRWPTVELEKTELDRLREIERGARALAEKLAA